MKEIKLKDIVAASLCQFGAFLFLTTFIFRPEVLTSYQSGDALALGPLPSALVTIVAMAVFGVICVAAAVREADHFERALSAFGFAVPCLSLALLLVRAPLVPPLVSALCGSACVVQAFGFARSNTLGFGATLLSVGLCLAVAAVASELSYRLFPLHLYGTMAVAGVMAVTGAVQLGAFCRKGWRAEADDSSDGDAGRALTAAAPALWEGLFCAASLGLTWNAVDFPGTRGHEAFFAVGAFAAVLAWLCLWLAWRRIRRADVVVYAAALPALLSLLLYIFSEGALLPLYFACAVASELFLLALLWASALAVDRSLRHPGLVACCLSRRLRCSFRVLHGGSSGCAHLCRAEGDAVSRPTLSRLPCRLRGVSRPPRTRGDCRRGGGRRRRARSISPGRSMSAAPSWRGSGASRRGKASFCRCSSWA